MKLIIQIPCLNEEAQLPTVLTGLPSSVLGVDVVESLIVDDGCTDRTVEVARELGVDHVVRLSTNRGLGSAFQAGIDACLKLGADLVVNIDADNQFFGADIGKLIEPIVEGRADMVVGDRGVATVEYFSWRKRSLQRLGSAVVGRASSTRVADATSGFRAYNRQAALTLHGCSRFTYTLETIVQAGRSALSVHSVPVRTAPSLRESRLFQSDRSYLRRAMPGLIRTYVRHEPLQIFGLGAAAVLSYLLLLWGRVPYLHLFPTAPPEHVASLVLGIALIALAVQLGMLGIVGSLLAHDRVLGERILERVRGVELQTGVIPSMYVAADRDPRGRGTATGESQVSSPAVHQEKPVAP